jgi:hypothetical protein
MAIFAGSCSFLLEVSSLTFVNMASSDSCLIHFDGKKGPLASFSLFSYQNFLDCRRIWLTLDGEERNVAQRSLQFVNDSMEVARSKISMQIYLIIELVVTRHSQIAVLSTELKSVVRIWTKKVYLHPLVSILLMKKWNQMKLHL